MVGRPRRATARSKGYAGRNEMYTQYLNPVPITQGPHHYAIRFTRTQTTRFAEYFLDGRLATRIDRVGIPLDVQGVDAFPFHHHESPELSVSIPRQERFFGQGARGAFDNFAVTTVDDGAATGAAR